MSTKEYRETHKEQIKEYSKQYRSKQRNNPTGINKLQQQRQELYSEYLQKFKLKHNLESVEDLDGFVFIFDDHYFFSINEIFDDIENYYPKSEILYWYDFTYCDPTPRINLKNWCKFGGHKNADKILTLETNRRLNEFDRNTAREKKEFLKGG